jgi:DoxX-like family
MNMQNSKAIDEAVPTIAEIAPVSKPALWFGRVLSGLVILFMLFDGAIKLVPWPVVTETMDRIGYGSSESLARALGVITVACTACADRESAVQPHAVWALSRGAGVGRTMVA